MDVVAHYSPPSTRVPSANDALSQRRPSQPAMATALSSSHDPAQKDAHSVIDSRRVSEAASTLLGGEQGQRSTVAESDDVQLEKERASNTFTRSVQISLNEQVGSMSVSPANRDVVLAARKGLFIVDLENPYDQPRFLPHLTTWVPADVQWNPHPARAHWVASTSNNKLLVWNLDRPAAHRNDPTFTLASPSASSPSVNSGLGIISPLSTQGAFASSTLPHPHLQPSDVVGSTSKLSSISHVLHAHTRAITDINWSPFHPDILASCGIDTWTWVWDLRDPSKPKQGYSAWNAAMTQVKWNRATQHRLATSCDNKVLIWDDRKGALPLATIEAHENKIYGVDWSRDTSLGLSRLVTCSLDGMVKWWNLDSPAAQQAIGQRQLVTEPETTIKTDTPVWRARHLPFGSGVMTLPQRGDTSLSMWSKEQRGEPVHRFKGHRDTVKEYLFRTRGGDDPGCDTREFQLITWSKDQTLRLWPITAAMMKSVGHERGKPIRVRQTRVGAANVSYRNPPLKMLDVNVMGTSPAVQTRSPISSANATPGTSLGMMPPSGATRSLLSGGGGVGGSSSKGHSTSHSSSMRVVSPPASYSPVGSGSGGHMFSPSSLGGSGGGVGSLESSQDRHPRRMVSVSQLAVRDNQRRKVGDGQGGARLRHPTSAASLLASGAKVGVQRTSSYAAMGSSNQDVTSSSGTNRRRRRRSTQEGDATKPAAAAAVMSQKAASRNFMTRGTMAHTGQLRSSGAAQRGNASRVDAVGWIAGVRMGRESKPVAVLTDGVTMPSAGETEAADSDAEVAQPAVVGKDAAQVLSEEIMSVSKRVGSDTFERIDVSARSCTATCYGPWAGKTVPCFVRITFHFPAAYPATAPRFELEHNASVALKTRAFLLRNVTTILSECARARPPMPSMEACLLFLLGNTLEPAVKSGVEQAGRHGFWLPGEGVADVEEDDDDDDDDDRAAGQVLAAFKMPPRRCGASFSANGLLVTFRPATHGSGTRPVSHPISSAISRQGGGGAAPSTGGPASDSLLAGGGIVSGRTRFLQSYSALAGAMTSLAGLTKEGMSVQDLDVVQLMGDEAFFMKRLQLAAGAATQQQQAQRHHQQVVATSSSPAAPALRPAKPSGKGRNSGGGEPAVVDARSATLALHARLGLLAGTSAESSRSRTRSRSGRARSASPMSARRALVTESGYVSPFTRASPLEQDGGAAAAAAAASHGTPTESRSQVHIWDVSSVLTTTTRSNASSRDHSVSGGARSASAAPPLIRRRSASTPASPAMTPVSETKTFLLTVGGNNSSRSRDSTATVNSTVLPSNVPRSLRGDADRVPESIARSRRDAQPEANGGVETDDSEDDYGHDEESADSIGYRIQESDDEDSEAEDESDAAELLRQTQDDALHPALEAVLDTLLWVVPFTFLYLMMDVMIQQQYALHPGVLDEVKRVANALPLLTVLIYFTAVRPQTFNYVVLQLSLFAIGTAAGCGFLFIYARSYQSVVTRRTAPLGTLWIYCVTRMHLTLAVAGLGVVYGFVTYHNLDLM